MPRHEKEIRADEIVSRLRVRGTIARLQENNNNKTDGGYRERQVERANRKMRVFKREGM